MKNYNQFVELCTQIQDSVAEIGETKDRSRVESLELLVRDSVKKMMFTIPYIEREVNQYALTRTQEIVTGKA